MMSNYRDILLSLLLRAMLLSGTLLSMAFPLLAGAGDTPPPTPPGPLPGGVREVIFSTRTRSPEGHWYANFGYVSTDTNYSYSGRQGRLCKLDVQTGALTNLIEDLEGAVRDPVVSYDGKRILFSWRKGGTACFNLYECDTDGGNLRQITKGPWDDIECCYLPDGGIIFVSTRSKRWVNCMLSQVATLFRCDADGRNIRNLSGNIEQDNSPWVLPDGRIIYTRWEYVDRSQMVYHHLWTMNPDGTGQMVYYGNYQPGGVFIDAKPVPGTKEVVASAYGGHGMRDHLGPVVLISPERGPDDPSALIPVTPRKYADHVDPYPLDRDHFLAGKGHALMLVRRQGDEETLFEHPDATIQLQDPRPLLPRPREPVIPARVDWSKPSGQLICQNVYAGRRMEGVRPGEIRKLLVLEALPKPVNFSGGPMPISYMSTFSLERILGTVPVEADGSANFEVPANRSIVLVALDEGNRSVKRMQSFLSVMPGEVSSCQGCHENRTQGPATQGGRPTQASQRPPSRIEPVPGIPGVYDFPRDVQPILDRHCLKCHDARTRAGGVELTGDRSAWFSMAYFHLMNRMQVFVGGNLPKSSYPPRTIGDVISPLMWKVCGAGEDVRLADTFNHDLEKVPRLEPIARNSHATVRLAPGEIQVLRFWINSGAVFAGTYAAMTPPPQQPVPGGGPLDVDLMAIPSVKRAVAVLERRCDGCHTGPNAVPRTPMPGGFLRGPNSSGWTEEQYAQPVMRVYSSLRVYNLSRPENSLMLLAPLAKAAGGLGLCEAGMARTNAVLKGAGALFASWRDPDYRALLAAIRDAGLRIEVITGYDRRGFIPNPHWVREMKRFGVLPADLDPGKTPIDVFATERKYWESLWYRPDLGMQWGPEM